MFRIASALHDLSLALLTGGLAGVFLAVGVLFDRAPSREIAGQIGNVIFGRLGPGALTLAVLLFAARLALMNRKESGGRAALFLASVILLLVAVAALILTPRMSAIWIGSPHAADGTGLMGEEESRFLTMHIMSNLAYMAALLTGASLIILRAIARGRNGR